jgi:predicted Zn-dependent protease
VTTDQESDMSLAPEDRTSEVNVGVLIASAPGAATDRIAAFARGIVDDVRPELEGVTGQRWVFDLADPIHLPNDDARRPADFLDEASLRMVQGPYDLVLVVTDVGVVSRKQRVVEGLASEVSRIAVLSTRRLLISPRGQPSRALEDAAVRANAATLALHLLGHLLGLDHTAGPGDVMAPFRFDEARREAPRFDPAVRVRLRARASDIPERTQATRGTLSALAFHLSSALRNPGVVLRPLWRNRAILLPLSLPSLATAAVAPTFILVFTAEIWDVGLNLQPSVVATFAGVSILAATWYLIRVQNLFFPQKEKRVLTEHLAALNVTVLLAMVLAMVGLFGMVALLMLFIEFYIFPPGLIATWPTLNDPRVTLLDRFVLASFISTNGVLTGALAGGLESRALIRHLALFEDDP